MEGTIAIQEKRSVVDKFKSWYQEKMIDSGHSAKLEEGIATAIDLGGDMFTLYCVVGAAAVTIVAAIPSSGLSIPLGAAISAGILAVGPAVTGIIKKFGTKAAVGTKRAMEAIIVGANGESETVDIKDVDITQDVIKAGEAAATHGTKIVTEYEKQKAEEAKKKEGQQADTAEEVPEVIELPEETSSMKM